MQPMVAQDTNGQQDLYEWEGGRIRLISTGTSSAGSSFAGASANGDDVYFLTRQSLVGQDTDDNVDLYDARVDGGLPSQNPSPQQPCAGDDCNPPAATAPTATPAASITFSGPPNPSSSVPATPSAKAKLLTKTVRGASFRIKVTVPAKGRIAI